MTEMTEMSMFDAVLSQGRPFGDSSYVHEQMRSAHLHRLKKVADGLPAAGRLLDALAGADRHREYRALGDPVVRCVIQQSLARATAGCEVVLPLALCEEVLDATARHLDAGTADGPSEAGAPRAHRLDPAAGPAWFWDPLRPDDAFGQAFRLLVAREFTDQLCPPEPSDVAVLRKAAELLREILPETSRSALHHTHVIGISPGVGAWARKSSTSQFRMAGIVFLNRRLLTNPWWVAEHLLHESLHQKLYDFRHAHSLLVRDVESDHGLPEEVRKVKSLWNSPGLTGTNQWDPHRTVAAFHVYVHLSLFCTLAEQHAPALESAYGPVDAPHPMTPGRKAFERAHYLGEQLRATTWPELGLAGRGLTDWLSSVLQALDPTPPPPGATLHLLLHRYLREAEKARKALPDPALERRLATLAEVEAASAQAVLVATGAPQDAAEVAAALAKHAAPERGAAFPQLRHFIADTLTRRAPDGKTLNSLAPHAPRHPDDMVRDMVEASSHALATMPEIT
ncbi:hypothetical protein ABZ953_01980 [Streptomyces sp. NPDC046465]|uniref:hypothetical protein n=1 Tax=Streptomyces sp. NPDC046465 TaxID=3155810 RepID=UPI0033E9064E